jgi:hypothetical protein
MRLLLCFLVAGLAHASSANSGLGVSNASVVSDLFSESRALAGGSPANSSQKALSVGAGATATLLNYSGSSGYLSVLWFGITGSEAAMTASTITITVDGEASPTINVRIPLYFAAEYCWNENNFGSRFLGCEQNGGSNIGYYSLIPVPFNSSIEVQLTNGDSGSGLTLWYEATYTTNVPNVWPRARKLYMATGTVTGLTVNETETLVDVSGLNPGRLFGIYLSIDSSPGSASPATAPLEGRVKIYFDGASSPNYQSSGTEDYFHFSNYFENTPSGFSTDYTGCPFISGSAVTWNCYRFHVLDAMTFQNALKVTWDAGYSTVVNYTGSVRLAYTVWYYSQ